ncbi:MAG TPA: TetR/AcrR family transcriptional regulator [Solirubrobacterales bacterium]|nr:TetR/AcrR family transcriptional regulator [Solirubrobacterales bacterium]HEX2467376.1 TetR/AcrR family transcriptional regulator [Solirubrobacterales bacterium]
MSQHNGVTPNRRGARSRELVLDAAERLMAEKGYGAATVSALVDEAGIPPSSVYHYFDSKEGVLLAVMERGAERFFEALPDLDTRLGSQAEQLTALVDTVTKTLERNPNFLRILVVMATQPVNVDGGEVNRVVERLRELALERLRDQMQSVFGLDRDSEDADQLARFALAAFDGAFVAYQADPKLRLRDLLRHLPAALIAVRRELR